MKRKRWLIGIPTFVFWLWMLLSERCEIGIATVLAAFLHECGHLLAAKLLKIPLRELKIDLLGARLEVSDKMISYSDEWLLSAAGPLSSFLCAILAFPLWKVLPSSAFFSAVSFLLGILNLLPIQTFDGGRMLECLFMPLFGEKRTTRLMGASSFLLLFLLWAVAVYCLLLANDGLSLLCFSMSLLMRFFEQKN